MALKIMIVDDDPEIRELFVDYFEDLKYNVLAAQDGVEALEIMEQSLVDLVITDLRMPRMNGFELLRRIKNEKPDIPVILITGYYATHGENRSALADGFLSKPIDFNELNRVVQDAFKKAYRKTVARPVGGKREQKKF